MRVLLATDSEILRPRLRAILAGVPRVDIVEDVSEERRVAEAARLTNPDIVIIAFPGLGGSTIRIVHDLRGATPGAVIIVLTAAFNEVNEGAWREAGATFVFDLMLQLGEFTDCLEKLTREIEVHDQFPSGNEAPGN